MAAPEKNFTGICCLRESQPKALDFRSLIIACEGAAQVRRGILMFK
jgi:hypothetical protein